MKVVICAAGTGGHINPAIAIANKIKKENKNAEILFIGTNRGLETDLVPRAGYELKTIDTYGLSKKINLENLKKLYKTYKSVGQAKKIINEYKPDIVIGTGGYICGPVFISAKKFKIPTVIHESNAYPGTAVKMLAKKTDVILVGFKEAKSRIKKSNKIVVTGTPTKVKKIILTEEKRKQMLMQNELNEKLPIVLVFGGSQGAKIINDTMIGILKNSLNENYQIIWAAGPTQYENIKKELEGVNIKNAKILPYIYNMEEIMNLADLVVARSGAMTITEISNIGKPAIFIPLPNVSHNHQEYNAKVLADIGAAEIIQNADLSDNLLNNTINKIVNNKEKMKEMGEKANRISISNVEDRIYNEICNVISKK